jgi:UDP-N-acetylglucosamine--N-acetylmuramyl-(pentapeptide) pyrophosphoryl-undecaprenol N-acetylglucosamine transferase
MKILVAAGGTGGHLFPALAVVENLEELSNEKIEFHFFGRADKIEGKVVSSLGYKLHTTELTGLVKVVSFNTLKLPFRLLSSILKLKKLIQRENIDAVLCAGAYLSIPAGIACRLCGKKLFLMESNVNPGKAINALAGSATAIYTSFDSTANYFNDPIKRKLKCFGNPVRKDIMQGCNVDKAFEKFGLDKNKRVVLIFGGSLGARAINNAVVKWLDNFSRIDYQILWQTGNSFMDKVDLPNNVKKVEFIDDMASAYTIADLVVSRSGATTIAELCVVGKPAVLVPLPSASNNEQYFNAKYLEEHQAVMIVRNDDILDNLYSVVDGLMCDKQRLLFMSDSLKLLSKVDASMKIAGDILEKIDFNLKYN